MDHDVRTAPGAQLAHYLTTGTTYVACAATVPSASAQRTMAVTDRVLHGGYEPVLQWFHRRLDAELAALR